MITKIFSYLTDYPAFRRLIWKPVYEALAKKFKVKDWSFMNYGYAPSKNEPPLDLDTADEINRYPIQLYYYLASQINVAGIDILEAGSGRGGGTSFIKRYLHPKKITGLDIALNAVKMAKENYGHEGIEFVQGSAERLPFADNSYDAIINVESCHAYGSVPTFLSEVNRVLRAGGYFLCADIRTAQGMISLKKHLRSSSMKLLSGEDISENVARAIELEEPVKQKRIRENIPRWMQKPFNEFAGVIGSRVHKELISGALVYERFLLQK